MITSQFVWLIALGPLIMAVLGLTSAIWANRRLRLVCKLTRVSALTSFLSAFTSLVWITVEGPLRSPLLGAQGLGLSLYIDAFSASMFTLVSFIGLIVVRL